MLYLTGSRLKGNVAAPSANIEPIHLVAFQEGLEIVR